MLYIFRFLHQTTTSGLLVLAFSLLYIFWFLHQTTTRWHHHISTWSCISFDSYIKPQRQGHLVQYAMVVYLLIPTSNHNVVGYLVGYRLLYIFWFLHQTTTKYFCICNTKELYIFWFLHQTTTPSIANVYSLRCISFDSYIKPQLPGIWIKIAICCISFDSYIKPQQYESCSRGRPVVYLLIPTSNHNNVFVVVAVFRLYIFWFLHQTTTVQH